MVASTGHPAGLSIAGVSDGQWEIVAWLWQAFRHDLALIVNGLPYADGRYQAAELSQYPSASGAGYLAWRPHPKTGENAPVGFALIDGLHGSQRSIPGFWVAPAARRDGIGRTLAIDVLSRHPGPWSIGFQHDNLGAGVFWRTVAGIAFGADRWTEILRPVPGRPDVPPDHFIESPGGRWQVTVPQPGDLQTSFCRGRGGRAKASGHPTASRATRRSLRFG